MSKTELFLRGGKLNISFVFISQSFFKVPKTIKINAIRYFILKVPNKKILCQVALNHSSDFYFTDFMKLYKKYTNEPNSFLANDTTLSLDNPLKFRKDLL